MRRVSLLILPLAALVATGSAVSAQRSDPVASAALKNARAGSVKFTFAMKTSAGSRGFTMTGRGLQSGRSAVIVMRFPASLVPPGGDPTIQAVMRMEHGAPVIYMKIGFLADRLPPGKTWIRMDVAQTAKKLGLDMTKLLGPSDPSAQAAILANASSTKRLGTERLRGSRVTHYRTKVDLTKVAGLGGAGATIKQLVALSGTKTMRLDAWVDSAGYLRRIRESFSQRDPASGLRTRVTVTLVYVSFGGPVTVKAPPSSRVVDFSALGS